MEYTAYKINLTLKFKSGLRESGIAFHNFVAK